MVQKRIDDYIKIYDNVIDIKFCNRLIDYYDNSNPVFVDSNYKPKFHHLVIDYGLSMELIPLIKPVLKSYFESLNSLEWIPLEYAYEEFRIKKYRKGTDDCFLNHVDVTDHASAKRFLSFFIYLNDVSYGGETEFVNLKKQIKPKAGRMLVFPPLWLFPHQGKPAISNDKYILGSYFHYI
jgi:hypothetical protein